MALGVAIFATAVSPLTSQGERVLAAVSFSRAPASTEAASPSTTDRIATAFGTFRVGDGGASHALRDSVATPAPPPASSQPQTADRCKDFDYSFLHRACSKTNPKQVAAKTITKQRWARPHRVATYVLAKEAPSPASATARPSSATAGRDKPASASSSKAPAKSASATLARPANALRAKRPSARQGAVAQEAPVQRAPLRLDMM